MDDLVITYYRLIHPGGTGHIDYISDDVNVVIATVGEHQRVGATTICGLTPSF
jgi:hypothetical protein